jgi:UDP-N-acetylmuramate--alanine ligase
MHKKSTHLHFVGIGGIGMSAIALVLKKQGYHVSGCDSIINQKNSIDLQKLGCPIYAGNNTTECHDDSIDVLVYSSAIDQHNPEIQRALDRVIPVVHRSELLAFLMRSKHSIAVTGSHGKTTTTSIVAHLLLNAEIDPTVLIGGNLNSIQSNAYAGSSDYLVAEADESDRSLLNLYPTIAILTNIDFDHAETYTDIDDITKTFIQFLDRIPFYGKAIVCADDPIIAKLLPLKNSPTLSYGFSKKANWKITDCVFKEESSIFTLEFNNQSFEPCTLLMPGKHNVLNATAAFAASYEIGIAPEKLIQGLQTFSGVDRRFTLKGVTDAGARIIDDYGHHPVEISNTITIARAQTQGKLIMAFQPHRYSRTKALWHDFLNMFLQSQLDELMITDIYAAGESPIESITGQNLTIALQGKNPPFKVTYLGVDPQFDILSSYCKSKLEKHDMLILQGAGSINQLAQKLITEL